MNVTKSNRGDCCFLVIKHSWKGKYRRVLSIGKTAIITYNPTSLEVTNQWAYNCIEDVCKIANSPNEFYISYRKDRKKGRNLINFSSDYTKLILTELLKYRHLFVERPQEYPKFNVYKYHWSSVRLPAMLEISPYALNQLDPTTKKIVASYYYHNIDHIVAISGHEPNSFAVAYGDISRLHVFTLNCPFSEFKQKLCDWSLLYLGIPIRDSSNCLSISDFYNHRFGPFNDDVHLTSLSEFTVYKIVHNRHQEPQRRILCLSETCLLERDPQTYSICTLRPFKEIFSLVRDYENAQAFQIEYFDGKLRFYSASNRDTLLATLLDSVRGAGNRDVHVKMLSTNRSLRWAPFCNLVDEETEIAQLKLLASSFEHMFRFNANIPYSGLTYSMSSERNFFENREKIVVSALQSVLSYNYESEKNEAFKLEAFFQCLRRLFAGKVGFNSFTTVNGIRESVGKKVVSSLKLKDEAVTHAAIDMLCALMHPMHDDFEIRFEQLNKTSLLMTNSFLESLLNMWMVHVELSTGTLIVSAMLDFLTFALCVPYSETTNSKQFDNLLEIMAEKGRKLFKLFQHDSGAIIKSAGLIMRALIEEGSTEIASKMQYLALSEGSLLRHLLISLFTQGSDNKSLAQRQLSRHLIGLWTTNNPAAISLLKRIMPIGLFQLLESQESVSDLLKEQELLNNRDNLKIAQEQNLNSTAWQSIERQLHVMEKKLEHFTNVSLQHWGTQVGLSLPILDLNRDNNAKNIRDKPIVLRKRREGIKSQSNWRLFYFKFSQDHLLPNLIWNYNTREELRIALENEIRILNNDKGLSGNLLISWNHKEFQVDYQSLANEIKIGDYYLRLLLAEGNENELIIRKCYEFFNDLYHQFLLSNKIDLKCMCLQAMTITYAKYFEDIGPFSDTKHCCFMLDKTVDKCERDRLVTFISKLALHEKNVRDILHSNGIKILIDLMTLAHLHKNRITIHSQKTNYIEASSDMEFEQHPEWYYNIEDSSGINKKGPITFKQLKELFEKNVINARTMCWAMGLDSWKALIQIPHLKWTFVAKGNAAMNESDLAILILKTFIQICEFYPSRDQDNVIIRPLSLVKRLLSDINALSHIVQLLLTFEPVIVEKVATLLCLLMQDNPMISKLYLTGVFYFILMYTGSNVLPIARFLQLTHKKQAFKTIDDYGNSNISILSPLLPEAMIYYLENHGPEKFAQIFLGEYDTPEAIWNSEMRRMLIEKISCHIADFVPHLLNHSMTRYSYIAIPAVRYPQLENELFCDIFYLRHLCDSSRFPNWEIVDPLGLLKQVLDAWKSEVEKKPLAMTIEDAYKSLGFTKNHPPDSESELRKAYYKLAQKYHPDKNPEGRTKFEQVTEAYNFLCSKNSWKNNGPDPNNIILIIRTQSILFERYSNVLKPYKYAGYPQLIKTIRFETKDDALFSKEVSILCYACELAYHTANCSALNVEEMRRENGLEVLLEAFSRCVNVLNKSSKSSDLAVKISYYIVKFIEVCGRFEFCRLRFVELTHLTVDLCRILHFRDLSQLCLVTIECISSLAKENTLQIQFVQNGILWHLLLFVFAYDYTLDEGGVTKNVEENKQEILNQLAKSAIMACGKLAGLFNKTDAMNPMVLATLEILLTKYITLQIDKKNIEEILKTLTSNCETPYLIWNHKCRVELKEYLEQQIQNVPNFDQCLNISFVYSEHKDELIISDIFVRVYNDQPTYNIEDPEKFIEGLLDFIQKNSSMLLSLMNVALSITIERIITYTVMVLDAMKNLMKHNSGIEKNCVGHFRLFFKLLEVPKESIQIGLLEVIEIATKNQNCITDIANCSQLGHFLLLFFKVPNALPLLLTIFSNLITNSKLLQEALIKGGVLYLLDFFCNLDSSKNDVREQCGEILTRMQSDPLIGPKIRLLLNQFLPLAFLDAMRENSSLCLRMFNETHENPELIWNDNLRRKVSKCIEELSLGFQQRQAQDPDSVCKVPEFSGLIQPNNEIIIGGIYLRLFLTNPNWVLRKPREFLLELLDATIAIMNRNDPDSLAKLETIVDSLCALLNAQPALNDQVPSMGHISNLCNQLSANRYQKYALSVLRQMAVSKPCITVFTQTPQFMISINNLLKSRKELIGLSCDTLHRLFTISSEQLHDRNDFLIRQAFETNLVPVLLDVLSSQTDFLDKPAVIKAQVVKILKIMANSSNYSEKVNAILDKNRVWHEYRDQKHDLFITDNHINNYLTGTPATAGYLTQSASNPIITVPPPILKSKNF